MMLSSYEPHKKYSFTYGSLTTLPTSDCFESLLIFHSGFFQDRRNLSHSDKINKDFFFKSSITQTITV